MNSTPVRTKLQTLSKFVSGTVELRRWRRANKKAIQLHRTCPLPLSPQCRNIVDELRRDGMSLFYLQDLEGGEDLLDGMIREFTHHHRVSDAAATEAPYHDDEALAERLRSYIMIVRPWQDHPSYDFVLARVALHPQILAIVNAYMQMASRVLSLAYWHTLISSGDPRSTQQWHRDFEDVRVLKMFIYEKASKCPAACGGDG